MIRKIIIILALLPIALFAKVYDVKINNLRECIGTELEGNFVSWKISSDKSGIEQKNYRVIVYDEDKNVVYDTGIVESQKQLQIPLNTKLEQAKKYFVKICVVDNYEEKSESETFFITGITRWQWMNSKWIRAKDHMRGAFLNNQLEVKGEIKNVYAYVCGLGFHEFILNDEKVGTKMLEPAWTNYEHYAFYTTYDISNLVKQGENDLKILLGDGWFNQDKVWAEHHLYYAPAMAKACFFIEYKDGTKEWFYTDENWKFTQSPTIASNIFAGESYDANLEGVFNWQAVDTPQGSHYVNDIKPSPVEPTRVMGEVKAKEIIDTTDGYIIDVGQITFGVCKIIVNEPKGTKIVLRLGENLNEARDTLDTRSIGVAANGVEQIETYISNGEPNQVWNARFTTHSFRYIEVKGLTQKPDLNFLTALQLNDDLTRIGNFECSHDTIMKLHFCALQAMRNMTMGVPASDSSREKSPWGGDTHAAAPAVSINLNAQAVWYKHLYDMRSSANIAKPAIFYNEWEKIFIDVKPLGIQFMANPGKRMCGWASCDWGTAMVHLPYYSYRYYGDEMVLREFYPDMKFWNSYVRSLLNEKGILDRNNLGDWSPAYGHDYSPHLNGIFFYYSELCIMEEVSTLLGYKDDADFYAAQKVITKKAIIDNFYDKEKKYYPSTKGDYASHGACTMALELGVFPDGDGESIANNMVKSSQENVHGFLNLGCFSVARIFTELSNFGNKEYAFKMFDKRGEHSFDWMFTAFEATSLWEGWPVYGGFDRMGGGKNHLFHCGFERFFYESIAGIKSNKPAYKEILFKPIFFEYLDWAKGSVDTPYGLTSSKWEKKDNSISWEIIIPASTSGKIEIPAFAKNILLDGKECKDYTLSLKSGTYKITFDI